MFVLLIPNILENQRALNTIDFTLWLTVLFNNMQNLTFKSPPTVVFFAADDQCSGSLKNESVEFNRVKRSHSLLWLVDFNPFCTLSWVTGGLGDHCIG